VNKGAPTRGGYSAARIASVQEMEIGGLKGGKEWLAEMRPSARLECRPAGSATTIGVVRGTAWTPVAQEPQGISEQLSSLSEPGI